MGKIDNIVDYYLNEEGLAEQIQFFLNETPKGWTKDTIEKFAKTLGKESATDKGFFDVCVTRMKKHDIKDPEGFCADLKDKVFGHTKWRSPKWRKEHEK
ncbi:MAG: hypothetical protein KQ78_02243 [Candidatus Izimaplasma bacterium HR2]|nr:MAG: hypothetical protein KQ78_02243 [Candidatus Izimaplasma bacterium HR2]